MSMNLGALVMRLVLEARQFRTEMSQATAQAEQEAAKLEGVTGRMQGAARAALASQGAAGRAAAGALQVVGPAATTAAAGIAVLAAGVAAAAVAYNQGSKEAQAYEKALILTGNASGTTAGQMADMARNIDLVVGTQAQAAAALAQMAGSGRVAGADLQKFTTTALEMERTVGTAVSDTVKQFAELGAAPVKASLALNETMNYLTASTYAQIKAAVELGDEERAASIAQNAYADAMGPRIAAIEQSLGTLERAWRGVKELAREAWDSMLNIGRPDSLATQMDNVRAKIAQAQGQDKNRPYSMPWDTPLADLQQQLAFLGEQERMIKRGTEAQTERNRVNKDAVEALDAVDKANERALNKQERANKALEEYRKNLAAIRLANDQNPSADLAAKLDPAVIARTEEAIRKSGESAARAVRVVATEQERMAQAGEKLADSLVAQESGLSGDFAQKWAQLNAAYEQNGWSVEKLTAAQAALLAQQPAMKAGMAAQTKEAAEIAKAMEAAAKATAAGVAEAERAAQQAEWQLATYGMLKSEVMALTLAQLEQARESAALAGEDVSNIEKRIAATKRLIAATRGIEQREDLDKTIKETTEAGQKMADSINSTLTDALMRGFESGKDFAKNLRDTVVNMFKTMVLRPVVSAIVNPISGALTGMMGLSGAAQAGQGGGGGGLGNLAMLGSLGGAFGTGMAASFTSMMSAGVGGWATAAGSLIGSGAGAGIAAGAGMIAAPLLAVAALWKPLFGRTLKDSGIQGTFGGASGFEGESFEYYKGGLFRSDKTKTDPLAEEMRKALGDTFLGMRNQVSAFADALGADTERLAGYTSAIKLSTKGLSEEDAKKKIEQALATASNELAEQIIGSWVSTAEDVKRQIAIQGGAGGDLDFRLGEITESVTASKYIPSEFARDGEKAIDTLTRLAASLSTVNAAFNNLGWTLKESSLAGADAASKFADLFGGLEGFAQAAGTYYENFYSEAEKAANVTRDITAALADVGLQMPATRQEFRALVEAQMALGESGAKAVAALLGVSGAFASIVGAAARTEAAMERTTRADNLRKQQEEERAAQAKAFEDGAKDFADLRAALASAGDAAGVLAAITARAFADPAKKYKAGGKEYDLPEWTEGSTAAMFNYRFGQMQARLSRDLSDELSANALRTENVGSALGTLSVENILGQYHPVTGPIYTAIRDSIVKAAGAASGNAVQTAIDGAALVAAQMQVRGDYGATGPGLASVNAARTYAGFVGGNLDVRAYDEAHMALERGLKRGTLSAAEFDRAVAALNETLPEAALLSGDFQAQAQRAAQAIESLSRAGLDSIGFYFGQMTTMALELAKVDEPVNATISAIGRLNSFSTAFGESAGAAGATGLQSGLIDRAQLVADSAALAAGAMTTASAAAAAKELAKSPAFAGLAAAGIRDASLLLDGIEQFNAESFERAFIRIGDALGREAITQDQYKALFDTALGAFNGLPDETRDLISGFEHLRDAMRSFADELLIDKGLTTLGGAATLAEMQRQYGEAFGLASTGDAEGINTYQSLARGLLDKGQYSSQAEYNAVFGRVYGDARQLESVGVNTIANAQNNEMVSELKDMNTKLNKRVEDLEKNLMAALAQIAKNTSDTTRGVRQLVIDGEVTP